MFKRVYRFLKWYFITIKSFGKSTKIVYINPQDIKSGQLPESQFSAQNTYKFVRAGAWDKKTIPVMEHELYRSYVKHFSEGQDWDKTPFYQMAAKKIENGETFRGEYRDINALKIRFQKCDQLYDQIKEFGYKSNRELFMEKKINNILFCLDEITVNISREGEVLLNDGWHRFVSARLLGLSTIPVRVLVRHTKAKQPITLLVN